MQENPELKAEFFLTMMEDGNMPPEAAEELMRNEDTFAALIRLGAVSDPLFQEIAGPMAELIEIQCRWIRENPDRVP